MIDKKLLIQTIHHMDEVTEELINIAREYAAYRLLHYNADIDDKGRNIKTFDSTLSKNKWAYFSKQDNQTEITLDFVTDENDITDFIVMGEEYFYGDTDYYSMTVPWQVVEDFDGWKKTFQTQREQEIKECQQNKLKEKEEKKKKKEELDFQQYLKLKEKFEKKSITPPIL